MLRADKREQKKKMERRNRRNERNKGEKGPGEGLTDVGMLEEQKSECQ